MDKKRSLFRSATFLAALGLCFFLLIWEAVPRLGWVHHAMLPPPSQLPFTLWREITSGYWGGAVLSSLEHYVVGLVLGAGCGVVLGTWTGMYARAEHLSAWVVRLLRPIPGLAWVPFAILWFGVGQGSAVFIICVGVFWIVYFAAHGAIRSVDRELIEVANAFGFTSGFQRLTKILLPCATPGILVGLRTALGQAWMAVVAAELFGVYGLGQRMMQASSLLATDVVVVYMLTMAALYGLFDTLFVVVQKWLLRWKA